MRKIASIIVFFMILFMLTGCYDSREISDSTYVAMLGIDEGTNNKWQITFLFPSLDKMNSGEEEGGKSSVKYTKYTIEASSFFEGVSLANTSIPKQIIFMHANAIVFSEALARDGKIGEFIAPLIRNREIRRTEFIIVSKGSANSFLEAASKNVESSITQEMEDLLGGTSYAGYFPTADLNDLNNGIKSTYHQVIAAYGDLNSGINKERDDSSNKNGNEIEYYAGDIPREGGPKIDLAGSAVINGDRMVGKLTGQETSMVLIIKGLLKKSTLAIPDPKKENLIVPIEIRLSKKPKINVKFEDKEPVIDIKLKLEGDILAIQSRIDYEDPKLTPVLEKAVEDFIEKELNKTFKKCKNLKSDVFNFGNIAVRQFLTIQEWEEYNWNKHFENAHINTSVKFNIRRTGTMISDSPIISTEDDEKENKWSGFL